MRGWFSVGLTFCATAMNAGTLGILNAQADTLNGHELKLDSSGQIIPWTSYGDILDRAWTRFKQVPLQSNGLRTYYTFPRFAGTGEHPFDGIPWAHNPAGLAAMITDSAIGYHAYSGDREVLDLSREFLDYILSHGTTPSDWAWGDVAFSSSNPGETEYAGGDDRVFCGGEACGRGDGPGFLEPDKIGELGLAYLRYYEVTGETRYLRAAVASADALVRNFRAGDALHSPWPFRVDARTGTQVREEYTANVIAPIELFDELSRLELGSYSLYQQTRDQAWRWLLDYPMSNGNWSAYFEDIPIHHDPAENPNQYSALETARYVLSHPSADPEWNDHARQLIAWTAERFAVDWEGRHGLEKGLQYGAEVLSEQKDDMAKMGSHTSRFASVLALYYEKTGDLPVRSRSLRSLSWASYMCDENGIVKVGTNDDEGYWFSDGYGDYLRHFLSTLSSLPEFAPTHESHLLRSSSVVQTISYQPDRIEYRTFDGGSTEELRVKSRPLRVESGGARLNLRDQLGSEGGYTLRALPDEGWVLQIQHPRETAVQIDFSP